MRHKYGVQRTNAMTTRRMPKLAPQNTFRTARRGEKECVNPSQHISDTSTTEPKQKSRIITID